VIKIGCELEFIRRRRRTSDAGSIPAGSKSQYSYQFNLIVDLMRVNQASGIGLIVIYLKP